MTAVFNSPSQLKAKHFTKASNRTIDGLLIGFVIFKSEKNEFLFSRRKTSFSDICEWVKFPSVAQIYDSFDKASQEALSISKSKAVPLSVCCLYDVGNEFVLV